MALVTLTLLCFIEKLSGYLLSLKEFIAASLAFCLGSGAPSVLCLQEENWCSWGQRAQTKVGMTATGWWALLQERGPTDLPSPVQNMQRSAVKSASSSRGTSATAAEELMLLRCGRYVQTMSFRFDFLRKIRGQSFYW